MRASPVRGGSALPKQGAPSGEPGWWGLVEGRRPRAGVTVGECRRGQPRGGACRPRPPPNRGRCVSTGAGKEGPTERRPLEGAAWWNRRSAWCCPPR
eukprot:5451085-Lingulodinium_polyedra.AAC.1